MADDATTETEQQTTEQQGASAQQQEQGREQDRQQEQARFTQADLDRYLGERLASERTKHQKALEDERAKAGKSEVEKAELERQQALDRAKEVTSAAATRIAASEAKGAARDLDARPDRLDAILRVADLKPCIGDDGEVDDVKVKAAVEKVLAEYPEWKKTPGSGAGRSGGEHQGGGGGKPTYTRADIDRMAAAGELVGDTLKAVNDALSDGRVSG